MKKAQSKVIVKGIGNKPATTKRVPAIKRNRYFDSAAMEMIAELSTFDMRNFTARTNIVQAAIINNANSNLSITDLDTNTNISRTWTPSGLSNIFKLQTCVNEITTLAAVYNSKATDKGIKKGGEDSLIAYCFDLIKSVPNVNTFLQQVYAAAIIYPQIKQGGINVYALETSAKYWGLITGVFQSIFDSINEDMQTDIDGFILALTTGGVNYNASNIMPQRSCNGAHYDIKVKGCEVASYYVGFSMCDKNRVAYWGKDGGNNAVKRIAFKDIEFIELSGKQTA